MTNNLINNFGSDRTISLTKLGRTSPIPVTRPSSRSIAAGSAIELAISPGPCFKRQKYKQLASE